MSEPTANSEAATAERSTRITGARCARPASASWWSNKMAKTAVVETVTRVPHPKFRKIIKQSKKFYAHDEENKAQVGDRVRIMETRPPQPVEALAPGRDPGALI